MLDKFFEPAVLTALVAGLVALFGHVWNPLSTRRLEKQKAEYAKDLAELNRKIHDLTADRDARRDYEYEARKRLYAEIEPLLFQLYDALEAGFAGIRGLARESRLGRLKRGDESWLADEYYQNTVVYRLLAPIAFLRIIQRRMTFVDFEVDETIRVKYQLLKMYARSFGHDIEFARGKPPLTYEPYHDDAETLLKTQPAIYDGQGIVAGDLESAADALLIKEDDHSLRPRTFGEFETLMKSCNEGVGPRIVIEFYREFTPETAPVVARMLLAQACLLKMLMELYAKGSADKVTEMRDAFLGSDGFLKDLCWTDQARLDIADADRVRTYIDRQMQRQPASARRG